MVLPFWVLYCTKERSFSASSAGQLLSIYGLGAICGTTLGGLLVQRFGPFRVQTTSLLLTGLAFVLLDRVTSFAGMAACLLLLSLVAEALRPASVTATTQVCPAYLHPRALALNRLAINLGMSIGPALGGFLAEINFSLLFYADAVSCVVAGLVSAMMFYDVQRPATSKTGSPGTAPPRLPWRDAHFICFSMLHFALAVVFFQFLSTYVLYLRDEFGFSSRVIGLLMAVNTVTIVFIEMVLVRSVEGWRRLRVVAWARPLYVSVSVCYRSAVAWCSR